MPLVRQRYQHFLEGAKCTLTCVISKGVVFEEIRHSDAGTNEPAAMRILLAATLVQVPLI